MKFFFSIFFLVIMTLNVTLPLVEQLRMGERFELSKVGADDTDEESKKEKEKEKESFSFSNMNGVHFGTFSLELFGKSLFGRNDLPKSELYASLPERPPQA